jgi:pectin methylesterase-like acyl-CoA thioesterase
VFNKSKKKTHKKGKPINLGMKEKVAAHGDEWQTIQVEFIVKAKAPSDKKSFLKIHLGEYLGKYQIRKASLKQITLM